MLVWFIPLRRKVTSISDVKTISLPHAQDDCLLKVWYPTTGWKSAVVMPDVTDKKVSTVHFSFVYLAHPRTVTGFSWRKTSKYMPKYVRHTHRLLHWCLSVMVMLAMCLVDTLLIVFTVVDILVWGLNLTDVQSQLYIYLLFYNDFKCG